VKQVSNRVVSTFLMLAIITTIGGLATILISTGGDMSLLTGLATTQTAIVNVTVSATAAITISPSIIEFGTGSLLGGTQTPINTTGGGVGNPGGFSKPSPINVTNDGNVDLNITINGTPAGNWLSTGSTYEWAGANSTEVLACNALSAGGFTNLTTSRNPFTAALRRVCANLTWSDANDMISIHIFLNLSTSTSASTYTDNSVLIHADQCRGPC